MLFKAAIDARDAHDAHELQEVQRVPETKGRRGLFKEAVEGETGETVHRVRDPGRAYICGSVCVWVTAELLGELCAISGAADSKRVPFITVAAHRTVSAWGRSAAFVLRDRQGWRRTSLA